MKLRCVRNSIRLRLRKSELDQLRLGNVIQEEVGFPGATPSLSFALEKSSQLTKLDASFENHSILITLPNTLAESWIKSNTVSIEQNLQLNNGEQLHILIEKDFPCKDREEEDKSDLFGELANEAPKIC